MTRFTITRSYYATYRTRVDLDPSQFDVLVRRVYGQTLNSGMHHCIWAGMEGFDRPASYC